MAWRTVAERELQRENGTFGSRSLDREWVILNCDACVSANAAIVISGLVLTVAQFLPVNIPPIIAHTPVRKCINDLKKEKKIQRKALFYRVSFVN